MMFPKFVLNEYLVSRGAVAWRSPSNIALVKYWGKLQSEGKPVQLPANASISLTLSKAYTDTRVGYSPRSSEDTWVTFSFEGREEISFAGRITKYLSSLTDMMPWLEQLSFDISSTNSFPHSAGIASSASSMSALALCLCDIQRNLYTEAAKGDDIATDFYKMASYVSRLGSGSASRSVYGPIAAWGASRHIADSSNEYATIVKGLHPVFETFCDDILIVSDAKKSVSSTAGHALMEENNYANSRYAQADKHLGQLLNIMKDGDLMSFGKIVEDEALTLHALMMCSDPSYILMKPATLEVIEIIRAFRKTHHLPIFFTLDAGPNVHILYPDVIKKEASEFINKHLLHLSIDNTVIKDQVGSGPIKLK